MTTKEGPYSKAPKWTRVPPHPGAGEGTDFVQLDVDKLEKQQDGGNTKLPRSVR